MQDNLPAAGSICLSESLVVRLIAATSRMTGLPREHITGPGRQRDLHRARAAICHVARKRGRSFNQISRPLNRDHTTIMSACDAARSYINRDQDFAWLCIALEREV